METAVGATGGGMDRADATAVGEILLEEELLGASRGLLFGLTSPRERFALEAAGEIFELLRGDGETERGCAGSLISSKLPPDEEEGNEFAIVFVISFSSSN